MFFLNHCRNIWSIISWEFSKYLFENDSNNMFLFTSLNIVQHNHYTRNNNNHNHRKEKKIPLSILCTQKKKHNVEGIARARVKRIHHPSYQEALFMVLARCSRRILFTRSLYRKWFVFCWQAFECAGVAVWPIEHLRTNALSEA